MDPDDSRMVEQASGWYQAKAGVPGGAAGHKLGPTLHRPSPVTPPEHKFCALGLQFEIKVYTVSL